jgi:DNA-binding Xre family transcriptional regulator
MGVLTVRGRKPKKAVNVDLGERKYTYRELSELIGVTVQTVRLMVADGRISKDNLRPARIGAGKKRDVTKLDFDKIYSRKEAVEILKIAPQTLDKMISDEYLLLVIVKGNEFVKRNGRK